MRLERELSSGILGWLQEHHRVELSSGSEAGSETSGEAIEVLDLTTGGTMMEAICEAVNQQPHPGHFGLLGTLRPMQMFPSIIHRRKLGWCLLQMQLRQLARR